MDKDKIAERLFAHGWAIIEEEGSFFIEKTTLEEGVLARYTGLDVIEPITERLEEEFSFYHLAFDWLIENFGDLMQYEIEVDNWLKK